MPNLAALAALALFTGAASAQEPDFERRINEALVRLKPSVRAAAGIGSPRRPTKQGWDGDAYLGPFGVKVDRSCLAFEGAAYPAAPAKLIAGLRTMHATLQKCASERIVPATVGLVYDYAARATVSCDPKACEYSDKSIRAWACTDQSTLEIKFKLREHYANPSTLLHELAHATKHVDNQSHEEHKQHRKYPLRDEVYFWERHCFHHQDLIKRMKEALEKRLEAAKLDRHSDSQPELSKIYKETFEVCATPFRYNVRRKLFATEPEIQAVCRQYSDYLMMEINLERLVRRMTAEAGGCSKAADKTECPAQAFFTPGTPERGALEAAGLLPPPQGPYSEKAFGEWTQKACALYDGSEVQGNPSGSLWVCARRLANRAADPEKLLELFAAGISWDEIGRLQDYFRRLDAKAEALMEGPGRYGNALAEAGPAKLREHFSGSLKVCAKPEVRDTRFCADLALDEAPMSLLGALFLHWQPKTLPLP